LIQDAATQRLEGGKEHPALHGDHGNSSSLHRQIQVALDEHRKQVGFTAREVLLGPSAQARVHALTSHVRRVSHDYCVARAQRVSHAQNSQDFLVRLGQEQVAAHVFALQRGQHIGHVGDLRHDQRAEVVDFAELLQRFTKAVGEQVTADKAHVLVQLFTAEDHLLQHGDVRRDAFIEEAPLTSTGFHGERKGSQFSCTLIQLDAEKVVCEDLFRDLSRVIALLFVHRIQQVEGIGEHVTGAARRIADFYVLWAGDLEE